MLLLHIGAFQLAIDHQRDSIWHRLTPRVRLLCALLFVFATALTPNGRWLTWLVYGSSLGLLIGLSRVTPIVLLRRVAVEFIFISLVLLGTLFQAGGQVVFQWGWIQITTEGLTVLGSVTLKALLSLLMLNLVVLTTEIPDLLHALTVLRMPPILVAILASMYRYIGVLIDELTAMRRAAISRNLMSNRHRQRQIMGNMIGALFIRTYERGDRIHQAMLSRGFTGLPPIKRPMRGSPIDPVALTLTTIILLIGQGIYWR